MLWAMLVIHGAFPTLSILSPVSSLAGRRSAVQLTCVWCRAKWPSAAKSGAGASPNFEEYINLGGIAGLSGERDTSSCELMIFISCLAY